MSECVLWTGPLNHHGYGVTKAGRSTMSAARAAWIEANGPIEDGLVIDHLCRNRPCVNVDHLEPVTPSENLRRAPRYRKDHCPQGHPLSGDNLYLQGTWRSCRTCRREASRRSITENHTYRDPDA